jgi:transposase, IS5 family
VGRLRRPRTPARLAGRKGAWRSSYLPLSYQSLCREVADSLSWRRFCRIGLDRPVPHPTTLVKLVRRAGPDVIEQLDAALLDRLAQGTLLPARKLRVNTTAVDADIDDPTDADLLEHAVRKLGGLVRRSKGRGAATKTGFRERGRAARRGCRRLARALRRRTGVAMAEVERLTGEVAAIARSTLRQVQVSSFTGRVGQLLALRAPDRPGAATLVPIAAPYGMGGVGKTLLALAYANAIERNMGPARPAARVQRRGRPGRSPCPAQSPPAPTSQARRSWPPGRAMRLETRRGGC